MTGVTVGFQARSLARQTLAHAEVDGAPDGSSGVAPDWRIAVLQAPEEFETTTPFAVLATVTVHADRRRLRASHIFMIEAERPAQQGAASDNELRTEIVRQFGRTMWRTGCVAVRQLAAVAEVDELGLPTEPPEPGNLDVRADSEDETEEPAARRSPTRDRRSAVGQAQRRSRRPSEAIEDQ